MIQISYPFLHLLIGLLFVVFCSNIYALYYSSVQHKAKRSQESSLQEANLLFVIELIEFLSTRGSSKLALLSIKEMNLVFVSQELRALLKEKRGLVQKLRDLAKESLLSTKELGRKEELETKLPSGELIHCSLLNKELMIVSIIDPAHRGEENLSNLPILLDGIDHEIKLPLGNLLLGIELIQEMNAVKKDGSLQIKVDEIHQLTMIVSTLLKNLPYILKASDSMGAIENELTLLDAKKCFEQILPYLQRMYDISFYDFSTETLLIKSNTEFMILIIENLVKNAVIHSQSKERDVSISLNADADNVLVHVGDSGRGIDANETAKLFKLSYSRNIEEFQGKGLGLFIASNTAHLHGGSIYVRSRKNTGSVFTLCLPKVKFG